MAAFDTAPNSASKCVHCGRKIKKGEVRFKCEKAYYGRMVSVCRECFDLYPIAMKQCVERSITGNHVLSVFNISRKIIDNDPNKTEIVRRIEIYTRTTIYEAWKMTDTIEVH